LLQASFWLSFVAVGALILADPGATSRRTNLEGWDAKLVQPGPFVEFRLMLGIRLFTYFKSLVREQWVVTVALAPLSILFFGQLSVSGMLANLMAIPWVTLCVTPLALAGWVWHPLWHVAAGAFEPLMWGLTWLSQWPSGVWHFAQAPMGLTLLAILGALICFQQWPWALRCWGVLWLLPIGLWQVPKPVWGQFDLWALDIGQGNAVLLRTAHHALLYDTGPTWGADADAGQRVLVPFMSRMGVDLDRLMLSHRDSDHTGGASAVLANHPHADLWTSLEAGHPLSQLRDVNRCYAGQKWTWDGVRFEVLHPALADYALNKTSNGLSCVLRIDASQGDLSQNGHDARTASALLVGDIEAPQEQALLQAHALQAVDFLLVPHHGSLTSSGFDFVQQLMPKWAVVQAGYRNRYGHPSPQVVARYAQLGVPLAMSPVCGAAHWQSQTPQALDCERNLKRRYWHFKAP
jgi:competence protein ComEC